MRVGYTRVPARMRVGHTRVPARMRVRQLSRHDQTTGTLIFMNWKIISKKEADF